jgi:inorganic pyrophosphatase/exopolyphosphatase
MARALHEVARDAVVAVIDHHEGECPYATASQDIQQVGSCASLVVSYVSTHAPQLLENNQALATLLLGAVVLDTGNLSEAASRCTPVDVAAAQRLGAHMGAHQVEELFNTLRANRTDQMGLSTPDLLRKCVISDPL